MKKIGLLILALVVALGGLGAGYAMWSDEINIEGRVGTAEVCLTWDPRTTPGLDNGVDPRFPEAPDYVRYWNKDVASTTVSGYGTDTLTITINNAYPGYYNDIELEYTNCGTIPVRLHDFVIVPDGFTIDPDIDWRNADGDGEIHLETSCNKEGVQLHPEQRDSCSFIILVTQDAIQDHTYTFTVTLEGVQWNEYNSGPLPSPV